MILSFDPNFQSDDYFLFEMPSNQFLEDVLNGKTQLEILSTSNPSDSVFISTQDTTFELLEFDTSNSLFVYNESQILSENHSTFDLRNFPSSYLKIRSILQQNYFTKEELSTGLINSSISFEDLFHSCQCSKIEFENILKELGAVKLEGFIKIPPPEVSNQITERIIAFIETLQNWKVELNLQELIRFFEGRYPDFIIIAIVGRLSENGELSETKLSRFIASKILSDKHLTMGEFEDLMKEFLPPSFRYDIDDYYGLFAFQDEKLLFVDEEKLPVNVIERFQFLFEICSIWEPKLIEPFFRNYTTKTLSFNDLATRYCRFADGCFMAF